MKLVIAAIMLCASGCAIFEMSGNATWVLKDHENQRGVISHDNYRRNWEKSREIAMAEIEQFCGAKKPMITQEQKESKVVGYETTTEAKGVGYGKSFGDHYLRSTGSVAPPTSYTSSSEPVYSHTVLLAFKCQDNTTAGTTGAR